MRNVQAVNLLNKLNLLSNVHLASSTRLLSCSVPNNILNKNKNTAGSEKNNAPKFNHSSRFSHGGSSHGKSQGFGASGIVYTLLGAGFAGGAVAVFLTSGSGSKDKTTVKTAVAKPTASKAAEVEESSEPAEEEEAAAAAVVAEEKPAKAAPAPAAAAPATPAPAKSKPSGAEQDEANFLPDIPSYVPYVIVGGGTAAMSAFKAIRAKDAKAKVLVITEEDYKPYMRPPLSKDLWMTDDESLIADLRFKQYNNNERSLFFLEDEFYTDVKTLSQNPNGGVAVATGKKVVNVDVQNRTVRLDNNWEITYDKCLIATGGKPRNLPALEKQWDNVKDKVTLFRNIEDFKRLYAIAKEGKTIAIVGGGFLGSELACALAHLSKKHGGKVIQIFPESGNLGRILPEYLSEWTTARLREEGVEIIPKATVNKAQSNNQKIELGLGSSDGSTTPPQWLLADHVIVAVGLEPNVQLASKSGFEVDRQHGGYLVNAELQARNNVWVAGDAACFYDIKLGRRRVEHHDHAVVSGRLAGENMTGAGKPYWHQSMFWSDLGPKIGFEAIGLVDSSLQTVGLFAKADETDTPKAQVQESNETLRSEVKDTKLPDVKPSASGADLRTPSKIDDFGKGVILYLKNETIVGVLLWNVFKRIPIARQLIQQQEKVADYAEMAKLFKINATGVEESVDN